MGLNHTWKPVAAALALSACTMDTSAYDPNDRTAEFNNSCRLVDGPNRPGVAITNPEWVDHRTDIADGPGNLRVTSTSGTVTHATFPDANHGTPQDLTVGWVNERPVYVIDCRDHDDSDHDQSGDPDTSTAEPGAPSDDFGGPQTDVDRGVGGPVDGPA